MLKKFRKLCKNEKGFTLIELLAVIVILGIIAAIAVPAIGNLIAKSEDDAHDANGLSLIEAARIAKVSGLDTTTVDSKTVYTMSDLNTAGYLDSIPSTPDGGDYDSAGSYVIVDGTDLKVVLKIDGGSTIFKTGGVTKEDINKGNARPTT